MFWMEGNEDSSSNEPADAPTPKISDRGHDNTVFADERGLPHLARQTNGQPRPLYIQNIENSRL